MDPRVELAALTGRIAYHVVKERITKPRPTNLRAVPPSPDHLTDEWLTLALCDGVRGARVLRHDLKQNPQAVVLVSVVVLELLLSARQWFR